LVIFVSLPARIARKLFLLLTFYYERWELNMKPRDFSKKDNIPMSDNSVTYSSGKASLAAASREHPPSSDQQAHIKEAHAERTQDKRAQISMKREKLLKQARHLKVAARAEAWASSPGLKTPT
jgi:hypothetical protein